jgi:hypothetical protein
MKSPDLGNTFLEASKTKHDSNLFWSFPVLPLAKFGSFILWMIAGPPTSQNWKKSPCTMAHLLFFILASKD